MWDIVWVLLEWFWQHIHTCTHVHVHVVPLDEATEEAGVNFYVYRGTFVSKNSRREDNLCTLVFVGFIRKTA